MSNPDPYRSPQTDFYGNAQYVGHRGNSALSTISAIFGAISVPFMCLCYMGLPLAIVAIICGHLGRAQVKNSGGRQGGAGTALAGLILGYLSVVFFVGSMGLLFLSASTSPGFGSATPNADGEFEFRQAETSVLHNVTQIDGESTTKQPAKPLAEHYLSSLQELDAMIAESEGQKTPPPPFPYSVYVRLNENSVIFLVKVPGFAGFPPEEQDAIRRNCWSIAHACVADVIPEDGEVGVVIFNSWSFDSAYLSSADPDNAKAELNDVQAELSSIFRHFSDLLTTENIEEWSEFDTQAEAEETDFEIMKAEAEDAEAEIHIEAAEIDEAEAEQAEAEMPEAEATEAEESDMLAEEP